jgi:hypothetical protein
MISSIYLFPGIYANFFHDQPKPPPPHAHMVTEPQMVIKEFIFLKKSSYYFLFFTL